MPRSHTPVVCEYARTPPLPRQIGRTPNLRIHPRSQRAMMVATHLKQRQPRPRLPEVASHRQRDQRHLRDIELFVANRAPKRA
jgi:hypothetical protein